MSRVTWKLFGREAKNEVMAVLALTVTAALLVVVIILSPILIPLHFVLRKLGRNGFFFRAFDSRTAGATKKRLTIGQSLFGYFSCGRFEGNPQTCLEWHVEESRAPEERVAYIQIQRERGRRNPLGTTTFRRHRESGVFWLGRRVDKEAYGCYVIQFLMVRTSSVPMYASNTLGGTSWHLWIVE